MPSSVVSRITVAGSNLPIGQTLPAPVAIGVMLALCSPEMWNMGNTARRGRLGPVEGSPTEAVWAAPRKLTTWTKPTTLRWLSIAAFGRPVVPEVNCSRAGWSSSISTSGRAASGTNASKSAKSSSMTTTGMPGSAPSRRARRLTSATSNFGAVWTRACWISSRVHQPLHATATAPSDTVAQNATIHSGQLAARMATRSPAATPRSVMAAATEATRRWWSAKVSTRLRPPSWKTA